MKIHCVLPALGYVVSCILSGKIILCMYSPSREKLQETVNSIYVSASKMLLLH